MTPFRAATLRSAGAALCLLVLGGSARACLLDVYPNANSPPTFNIFPNWYRTKVAIYDLSYCDALTCAGYNDADIAGITLVNYGNANGTTDITAVYFCIECTGACNAPTETLTYAGIWTVDGVPYPAWTWTPAIFPYIFNPDPCDAGAGGKGCNAPCTPAMHVWIDVGPCPANMAIVAIGPIYNEILGTPGILDQYWCGGPWGTLQDPNPKTITYVVKQADFDHVPPGDTITYTIWYGKPGTGSLTSVEVMDSLPPFTHLVFGSPVPAADPGWDPDPGPPMRLRWTVPSGTTAGGATSEIRFQVTVDWGNGESFEPGSGDVACPEGQRITNNAQAFWRGMTGCSNTTVVSEGEDTVVKRFLFWEVADNDILFAPSFGAPDDEITYEVYIKNLSSSKTWWKVSIWDTVPSQIDVWGPGYGFEDPCSGWTMTPSGCAAGTPNWSAAGGNTLLRWKMDMNPNQTLSLRFKGKVKPTTPADVTGISRVSVLAYGATNIVGGSGHSQVPSNFTQVAKIVLRTTYFSYTSMTSSQDVGNGAFAAWFLPFFPLNRQTDFELRKLEYTASAGVAGVGGKSATISVLLGSCTGGFADGGFSMPGCKAERSPAIYWPALLWTGWMDLLYKVTSNSPVLWQTMSQVQCGCHDSHTFAPSTSLTYRGFAHYACLRPDETALATAGHGERVAVINTNMNYLDAQIANLPTTVHLFKWDAANLNWSYVISGDLDNESIWVPLEGTYATVANTVQYLRVISSDAQCLVYEGLHTFGIPSIGGAYDNNGAFAACRENGNLVNATAPATFYLIARHDSAPNVVVGNLGTVNATYRVWKYKPKSSRVAPNFPTTLAGTSGSWINVSTDSVDYTGGVGIGGTPGNPHVYGNNYDLTMVSGTPAGTGWKIELLTGGAHIQVDFGANIYNGCGGACNMHDAMGDQAGQDFWLNHARTSGCGNMAKGTETTMYVNVFCPKTGMAVNVTSSNGASSTYTTDGPDQCIVFMGITSGGNAPYRANYRFTLRPGGSQGDLICQYHQSSGTEKAFTAPFVRTGTHYSIIAPATVYGSQSFWITVVVIDSGGGTKTDYCGTTSFTSTDPTAKVETQPMDAFNYTWKSNIGAGCNAGSDNGVKLFFNVSMTKLGLQTIVAMDTMDGSITGITTVMVVGVDIKLEKLPKLSLAASADTVRFRICWSNFSTASAFTFVMTDAVPEGTTFLPESGSAGLDCGNTDGTPLAVAYSTLTTPTVPLPASFITGNPVSGTHWLRWTLPVAGIQTTGCACFRVVVN